MNFKETDIIPQGSCHLNVLAPFNSMSVVRSFHSIRAAVFIIPEMRRYTNYFNGPVASYNEFQINFKLEALWMTWGRYTPGNSCTQKFFSRPILWAKRWCEDKLTQGREHKLKRFELSDFQLHTPYLSSVSWTLFQLSPSSFICIKWHWQDLITKAGTRVFYWSASNEVIYSIVQSSSFLPDVGDQ